MDINEVRTTGNKILIEVEKKSKEPEETKTGILLATPTEPSATLTAKVLGIGKDVKEVQVGDLVCCEKMTTQEFKLDGEEYRIVPEASVLGYKRDNENENENEEKESINE